VAWRPAAVRSLFTGRTGGVGKTLAAPGWIARELKRPAPEPSTLFGGRVMSSFLGPDRGKNLRFVLDYAKRRGMQSCLLDEARWPSGKSDADDFQRKSVNSKRLWDGAPGKKIDDWPLDRAS